MATKKHKHVLNLRAVAALVKKPGNSNAYSRINLIMKGADFAATPELLLEVEKIIKDETNKTLKFLENIRKGLLVQDKQTAA